MNEAARKRALSLLDKRDYSRKMLIDKLTDKGVTAEDAAEVVDRLCAVGVVDDARYAALVVRHYSGRGYGERRIREELYHRGIGRELWDEALEEAGEPDSTVSPEDMERARSYLLRRGFSREEVRGALERYASENEER